MKTQKELSKSGFTSFDHDVLSDERLNYLDCLIINYQWGLIRSGKNPADVATLMKKCRASERTVQRSLRNLLLCGYEDVLPPRWRLRGVKNVGKSVKNVGTEPSKMSAKASKMSAKASKMSAKASFLTEGSEVKSSGKNSKNSKIEEYKTEEAVVAAAPPVENRHEPNADTRKQEAEITTIISQEEPTGFQDDYLAFLKKEQAKLNKVERQRMACADFYKKHNRKPTQQEEAEIRFLVDQGNL